MRRGLQDDVAVKPTSAVTAIAPSGETLESSVIATAIDSTRRCPLEDRRFAWMSSTSTVFPILALITSLLTFFTTPPTAAIALLLLLALAPWALVGCGFDVPPVLVVTVSLVAVTWMVAGHDDQAALFLGVVACTWTAAKGLRWVSMYSVVGFTIASIACDATGDGGKPFWVIWATGMGFGWFSGSLLFRQNLLMDQLASVRSSLVLAAAEQERKAIAREVHDIVGHSLTVVLLNIAGARRHLATNPTAAAEALERAESISRDSLETVRSVVGLLSTSGDSQRNAPLPDGGDVVPLLEQAKRSGLPLSLSIDGDPTELEPAVGLTVVRLLQEALANATRHAPGEGIDVSIQISSSTVTTVISNSVLTGQPASANKTPARPGLGVASMTDRVAALHGSLDIGVRDARWVVRGVLPRAMSRAVDATLR